MSENQEWNARIFADKVIKKAVQDEVEKLALVLLGNHELKIRYSKEGFDPYSYCNHSTKQFCPVGNKTMHYSGSWREWRVLGRTKTDVYLEVIRMLGNDSSTYYPIVAPRYNKDWVDREEYNALQEENNLMKQYVKNGLEMGYIDDREKDYEVFLGKTEQD